MFNLLFNCLPIFNYYYETISKPTIKIRPHLTSKQINNFYSNTLHLHNGHVLLSYSIIHCFIQSS